MLLKISNLHARIGKKNILKNVNLNIQQGEIHAIMGPNGSGKSTLAKILMGHPQYSINKGEIKYLNKDLLNMAPDLRAREGVFLGFQYPREITGVNMLNFLLSAYKSRLSKDEAKKITVFKFKKLVEEQMKYLKIKKEFTDRYLNHGFSGGEKKKSEILQMAILKPKLAILDEIDSGLDIDALRIVCETINLAKQQNKNMSLILITHYERLLKYIKPDYVHVMFDGKIVKSGDHKFAEKKKQKGYEWLEN